MASQLTPCLLLLKLDSSVFPRTPYEIKHIITDVAQKAHCLEGFYVISDSGELIPQKDYPFQLPARRIRGSFWLEEEVEQFDSLFNSSRDRIVIPLHLLAENQSTPVEIYHNVSGYHLHLQAA